jgi:curli biogenesis system outer membrane secretion channel CsgG
MRHRVIAAAALAAAVALPLALAAEDEDARPGLAVLPAENRIENQWWAESGAGAGQDIFIDRLAEAGDYRVLDRAGLDARIQEEGLWLPAGEVTPASAIKLSRQLGVRYLLTGALTEYGTGREGRKGSGGRRLMGLRAPRSFAVAFSVRLLDGETGAIVWTDGRRAEHAPDVPVATGAEDSADDEDARMFEQVLRPMLESLAESLATGESSAAPG